MKIIVCYNPTLGKHLVFEATNNQDKKSLAQFSNELTSCGVKHGKLSVNNKSIELTLQCGKLGQFNYN